MKANSQIALNLHFVLGNIYQDNLFSILKGSIISVGFEVISHRFTVKNIVIEFFERLIANCENEIYKILDYRLVTSCSSDL